MFRTKHISIDESWSDLRSKLCGSESERVHAFTKETGILIPKPLIVRVVCLSIARMFTTSHTIILGTIASCVACGLIRDQTSRRDDVFVPSSALRSFYDAHNPDR